jgi:hypothetical protein
VAIRIFGVGEDGTNAGGLSGLRESKLETDHRNSYLFLRFQWGFYMAGKLTKTHVVSIICAIIGAAALMGSPLLSKRSSQQNIAGNNNYQVGDGATLTLAQTSPTLPSVGTESVVIGEVNRNVGDRSVVIGATDDRHNTRLQQGAYGYGSCAGPGSLAAGAYAGAGCRPSAPPTSK